MSKEIYISSTPHETRLAIVENDALTEIYYERENEYTLAGSIYNGRVTRVLPGMQSAFVDIGLERDAFLYITDFMEEVPDAAEFDTTSNGDHRAPRLGSGEPAPQSQERSGDRGGRQRRGGRDRDRGDRGGDARTTAPASSEPAQPYAPEPYADSDTGQPLSESSEAGFGANAAGESGPEGSRRWRGRRGRRRGGRGNATQPAETSQSAEQPGFGADPDAEGETLFEGGADLDESTGYDLGASADLSETPAPTAAPREGERREGRRGRSDRNRRGGRDRRAEPQTERQTDQAPLPPRTEARTEQQDRTQRYPRGFAPSRNLYGVDDEAAVSAGSPAAEPVILPGESLSKYRKPSESTPGETSAAAATPAVTLAPPTTLYTLAAGWDGGDVLPGETLSRRRSPEPTASHPDADRRARFDRGSRRDDRRSESRESRFAAPAETPAPVVEAHIEHSERAALPPAEPAVTAGFAAAHEPEAAPHTAPPPAAEAPAPAHEEALSATPQESAEYEPTDASVSYRVDPLAPVEFRHPSPTLEPPVEAATESEPEFHEQSTEPWTHDEANLTHSITPGPGEHLAPLHSEAEPSAPIESIAEEQAPAATSHDITSISAAGEMHSHLETIDAPSTVQVAEPADATSTLTSASPAVLQEEELEDDEPASATLHASSFEELDDLDEESIEGGADLGTMIREMSIDSITRTSPDATDDLEDDFVEDDLEDDFDEEESESDDREIGEEEHEEVALHEQDGLDHDAHRRAAAEADSEHFDDNAGYAATTSTPGFDEASPTDPSTQPRRGDRTDDRRGGRRDGRRDGRRGRSDRGPRMGSASSSPERGRGRQSMQSTNLPAISDLLKPGQEILVQIAKEPIAKKGARITSHIALPGRFLVFMPTVNHTGVSRKIESDSERRRLKEILLSEKGEASGGFIVRTAASGATEEELRSDLRFLLNLWSDIKTRSDSSKSPALIYHDLNLIERILRDQVTDTFSAIWVDSETEYERVLRFLQRFQPSLIRRVKLYSKEMPLFEQFGITEEINKALRSKVWLKSGGSIVINQTEALVAIDINTGKYVGKTARLEDTIVKTNLDAIPEIVRQIRLRDLGGIIIIDFIDMDERKNRNRVMAALEEELKTDRAPSKVLQFNDFGLVAITRKRVKQSLERTLSTPCNVCQGTGMVKSPVTVCNDIYIEIRKMHKHLDRGDVMLRVHPEVVKQLKASGSHWLQEMEEMVGKTILVKSDPSLHPEQFDIH